MAPKRQPKSSVRRMAGKKGPAVQLQQEINSDEEWEQLMKKEGLIVVDVYSEWCGPCIGMIGNLKKVKLEIGGDLMILAIAKSDNIEALKRFRNKSEPTWMFFGSGQYVNLMFGANSPELNKMLLEELEKEKKVLEGLATRVVIPPGEMAEAERIRWEATEKVRLEEEGVRKAEEERKKMEKHNRLMSRLKTFLLDVSIIIHFDFATRPLPEPEIIPSEESFIEKLSEEYEGEMEGEEEVEEVKEEDIKEVVSETTEGPMDEDEEEEEEEEEGQEKKYIVPGLPEEPEEEEIKLSPLDLFKTALKKSGFSIVKQIRAKMCAEEVAEIFNVDPTTLLRSEVQEPMHLKIIEKRREHLYYDDNDGLPYDPINKDNMDDVYMMVYGQPPPSIHVQESKKRYFPHEEKEVFEEELRLSDFALGQKSADQIESVKEDELKFDEGEIFGFEEEMEEEQEEEEEIIDMMRQPEAAPDSLAAQSTNLFGLRAFYTPGNVEEKVNLIRKYFESFISKYYEPEIPPPPPAIVLVYNAHDRRPIHRLILAHEDNVLMYGYFDCDDPTKAKLLAKKLKYYEALPYSIKKPFTDKLVVVLNITKEEPMLTFVNVVNPEYVTPETVDRNADILRWFPPEEEKKEEEEDDKEAPRRKKKKEESATLVEDSGDELEDDAPDYLLDSESKERMHDREKEELDEEEEEKIPIDDVVIPDYYARASQEYEGEGHEAGLEEEEEGEGEIGEIKVEDEGGKIEGDEEQEAAEEGDHEEAPEGDPEEQQEEEKPPA